MSNDKQGGFNFDLFLRSLNTGAQEMMYDQRCPIIWPRKSVLKTEQSARQTSALAPFSSAHGTRHISAVVANTLNRCPSGRTVSNREKVRAKNAGQGAMLVIFSPLSHFVTGTLILRKSLISNLR